MIVIRVELWSAVTGIKTELARMTIDNVGGTPQRGDYRARTMRGRSEMALHKAMLTNTFQREGRVLGHERLKLHVWNLVAKALASMGYGNSSTPFVADSHSVPNAPAALTSPPPTGANSSEVPHG